MLHITLVNNIDLNKYTENSIESFILKPGIRTTTTLKHASKKEVNVQVFGLHPDTKDETVIRYLNAHGVVNMLEPVRYALYPGAPGSSLLAGKRNGNRIYSMVVKKNLGSTHIIDGERVSIKYSGQRKTCNRCHKEASKCPGKALARNCTSARVSLYDHMQSYWNDINFNPETTEINDIEENESELSEAILVTDQAPKTFQKVSSENEFSNKYGGVVLKGFRKGDPIEGILEILKAAGLPGDFGVEDLQPVERGNSLTVNIHELQPKPCISLINNLNGKVVNDHVIKAFALVDDTPSKNDNSKDLVNDDDSASTPKQTQLTAIISNLAKKPPLPLTPMSSRSAVVTSDTSNSSKNWDNKIEDSDAESTSSDSSILEQFKKLSKKLKRKAVESPENPSPNDLEKVLTKKQRRKLRKSLEKQK